jgi:hypothetical protein
MIGIELDRPCGDLVKRGLENGRPADQRHRRQGGAPAAAAGDSAMPKRGTGGQRWRR